MGVLARLFGGRDNPEPLETVWLDGLGRGSPSFEIVGESHYQAALEDICGPKCEEGYHYSCSANLIPEPTNSYDRNAIRVDIDGRTVGYLRRDDAAKFKEDMANLGKAGYPAACLAVIVGGWDRGDGDEGHFGVKLDIAWPLKIGAPFSRR